MTDTQNIPVTLLHSLYSKMLEIREAEERLADLVANNEIRCPVHLYIGQEAVATGVCAALNDDDYIFGTHRSHGHYLAKGGQLKPMMAEIFGKRTGTSKGRGGSMHLTAPEVGLMGTSAIVATGLPLAVGAGIAFAMQNTQKVSVAFFGDGAVEEGVFFESLNIAALKKAPVVFVCENNLYSSHLQLLERRPADNIVEIAATAPMPSISIDGNDVLAVYQAAQQAVERARSGQGSTFIECRTYRWRGHVGPNYDVDKGLRSQKELDEWIARCPIENLEQRLLNEKLLSTEDANQIRKTAAAKVAEAITFAKESPLPRASELNDYVFRTQVGGNTYV